MSDSGPILPTELAALLGIDEVTAGPTAADRSLEDLFEEASRLRGGVKLLRLAAPKRFRNDIKSFIVGDQQSITPGFRLLLDPNLKHIEVLLSNPYCEAFLTRMDAERKEPADIWRVRSEVLEFAGGLIRAGLQREMQGHSSVLIGFHSSALFWNLGIAADQSVTLRAYNRDATGHDGKVAELRLRTGGRARLAEALIAYYEQLKSEHSTIFVHSENDLPSVLGGWPSLYKGNAIWFSEETTLEKGCTTRSSYLAEFAWCSDLSPTRHSVYFKPVRIARVLDRKEHDQPSVLCFHRIDGITCRNLALRVREVALENPKELTLCQEILGILGMQALHALAEFRNVAREDRKLQSRLRKYPWSEKLQKAVAETALYVSRQRPLIAKCISDVSDLGREISQDVDTPFRDATLKNRVVKFGNTDTSSRMIHDWITDTDPSHVYEWLRLNTFDIDFESGLTLVNKWDDVLHIICDSTMGLLDFSHKSLDLLGAVGRWWSVPQEGRDVDLIWKTLLARSLREYCRRIWYWNVMPNSYQVRYGEEPATHFLKLAQASAKNIDGFSAIKEFLDLCPTIDREDAPLISKLVPAIRYSHENIHHGVVFISYSHRNSDFARRLAADLRKEGIKVWIDHRAVSAGENITTSIDSVLSKAAFVIALVSQSSLESAWCNEEWSATLNAHLAGKSVILIPLVLEPC